MNRLLNYVRATRGELKHVSWPTQKQTTSFTILVILISLVTAGYLGLLDNAFANLLELIV